MTIRRTLIAAFLLVSLAPTVVFSWFAFVKTREAIQSDLEESLAVQASGISADIDKVSADINKMLYERIQDAQTWSRLDVMQNIRAHDADKRLSSFFSQLKAGYGGVYQSLFSTDDSGRVVASSDPALIGSRPAARPIGLRAAFPGGTVTLQSSDRGGDDAAPLLAIRSAIPSSMGSSSLGEITLLFDWSQVYALLDQNAKAGGMLALLDQDGTIVAASLELRRRGLSSGKALAGWLPKERGKSVSIHRGEPLIDSDVMVGVDRSPGFVHLAGVELSTMIIQPLSEPLFPVRKMAWVFLTLLGATLLGTIAISIWVAREIARPITSLTGFTQRFMRQKALPAAPPKAGGEVGELSQAFVQMVRELDQSKQNLVRASKLAVVGEMAAVIAHEVRTPLGILRSSCQILKREPALSDEGKELLGFIESETERLNQLVAAMLDGARPRSPQFRRTDMHELIRKSVALMSTQAGKRMVRISEALGASDPWVECDPEQMTQVMLNLILNALQILASGGHIMITTRDEAAKILIEIADDGPGIAPEDRSRVFETFFFKREGGIGLGLAIVQQIVAAHSGEVGASESDMGGALFTIKMPRRAQGES